MSSKSNKKEIKNVVIVNDFNYIQGGASKVAIDTAKLLKNNNIKVYFFSAVNKIEDNIEGIEYISTNQVEALKDTRRIRGIINGIYNFKVKNRFKKLLRTLDKEETVIHVHGWTKALSCSVFDVAFKMNFKVFLTLHDYFTACPNGGFFNYKKNIICDKKPLSGSCLICNCDSRNYGFKLYRMLRQFIQNKVVKLNRKVKYVIGISDLSIQVLSSTFNNNTKIRKIYNPIDFDKNEKKVNYKNNTYYLYVGRISKEKGVDIFCEAITQLNLKGIIVGDGSEKERLQAKYPGIEFTGWKKREEVKEYIRKAKCLIFPSLWYEGAPLTPLESMGVGVPCLVNGCCAAKEYDENNNFNSYEELLNKLDKIERGCFEYEYNKLLMDKFEPSTYIRNLMEYYMSE